MKEKIIPFAGPVCYHCLADDKKLISIEIDEVGWYSGFDGFETKIFLCEDCLNKLNPSWYPLEIINDPNDMGCDYKDEDELFKFISSCDIRVKELFYNRFDNGSDAHKMDPQHWIDFELGILPHDICKQYGLISCDERSAYEEKYSKCAHVFNVQMGKSCTSSCPFNASGKENGELNEQASTKCYGCEYFKEKPEGFTYKKVRFEEKHDYATLKKIMLDPERRKWLEE